MCLGLLELTIEVPPRYSWLSLIELASIHPVTFKSGTSSIDFDEVNEYPRTRYF